MFSTTTPEILQQEKLIVVQAIKFNDCDRFVEIYKGIRNKYETLSASYGIDWKLNKDGDTLLSFACVNGNIDIILYLLINGAQMDINMRNLKGETPAFHAVLAGNLNLLKILTDYGAIISSQLYQINTFPNSNISLYEIAAIKGLDRILEYIGELTPHHLHISSVINNFVVSQQNLRIIDGIIRHSVAAEDYLTRIRLLLTSISDGNENVCQVVLESLVNPITYWYDCSIVPKNVFFMVVKKIYLKHTTTMRSVFDHGCSYENFCFAGSFPLSEEKVAFLEMFLAYCDVQLPNSSYKYITEMYYYISHSDRPCDTLFLTDKFLNLVVKYLFLDYVRGSILGDSHRTQRFLVENKTFDDKVKRIKYHLAYTDCEEELIRLKTITIRCDNSVTFYDILMYQDIQILSNLFKRPIIFNCFTEYPIFQTILWQKLKVGANRRAILNIAISYMQSNSILCENICEMVLTKLESLFIEKFIRVLSVTNWRDEILSEEKKLTNAYEYDGKLEYRPIKSIEVSSNLDMLEYW